MSKAEEFIQAKTRIGSNTSSNGWRRKGVFIPSYSLPWLTPDDARKAVYIAREEMIEKVCMYLNEHRNGVIDDEYIINLNKAMKDETQNL